MGEYIEREALLKDIEEERPENWTDSESERQAESDFYKYRDIVMMQPAADVVEVVRCKDCKHFMTDTFKRTMCNRTFTMFEMNENNFCSYGVRKEGET